MKGGQLHMPIVQLCFYVLVPYNGSGNELREERDVKQEPAVGFLYLCIPAVHVDYVGHGLKREKADPYGHFQGECRKLQDKKSIPEAEERQIEYDRRDQPSFADPDLRRFADDTPEAVVHRHQTDHKKYVHRFAKRVEKQRKRRQHDPAICIVSNDKVREKERRQKYIEKKQIGKIHYGGAFLSIAARAYRRTSGAC